MHVRGRNLKRDSVGRHGLPLVVIVLPPLAVNVLLDARGRKYEAKKVNGQGSTTKENLSRMSKDFLALDLA